MCCHAVPRCPSVFNSLWHLCGRAGTVGCLICCDPGMVCRFSHVFPCFVLPDAGISVFALCDLAPVSLHLQDFRRICMLKLNRWFFIYIYISYISLYDALMMSLAMYIGHHYWTIFHNCVSCVGFSCLRTSGCRDSIGNWGILGQLRTSWLLVLIHGHEPQLVEDLACPTLPRDGG